ncbi:MAG: cyclopropane-fatty-acyl-phospholipid synthase family protein [Campylobacterota bacterium]|nr:cyclopropane-fatty-acyl-phospholipid synthase family protein [Campylobacterota bacterium]
MKTIVNELLNNLSDRMPCEVIYWDGERVNFGKGNPQFRIHIKSTSIIRDIMSNFSLGFGENYMDGNIVIEGDLQKLTGIRYEESARKFKVSNKTKIRIFLNYIKTLNTVKKAKKNISHHYDLSNDFYRLMLDKSMTYSCAYFKDGKDTLEKAQENKYELICKKLNLKDGDRLIDVGCGWGGMIIYAARKFDIKATGITISKNQYEYAKECIKTEGLMDRANVLLEDYRNVKGKFNKFVSIGMFEHVGKKYSRPFFRKTKELLQTKAIGVLHTIANNAYEPTDPWTRKYIFPGGYIPVLSDILRDMANVGFYTIDVENLRPNYAKTLDEWIKCFESNIDKVKTMFDERFINMWRLYLNAASVSFKVGKLGVYQIVFSNSLRGTIPLNRNYIYESW